MSDKIETINATDIHPVTVKEAAQMLQVSERTIYRRLKSGKINLSNSPTVSDTNDKVTVTAPRLNSVPNVSELCHNVVGKNDIDIDYRSTLQSVRNELAKRDAQIESLLENQRALTLTVQKLQEQLFELARLALSVSPKETAPLPDQVRTQERSQSFLARLLRLQENTPRTPVKKPSGGK